MNITPDAPRSPEPADRRRILDALDAGYLPERGRYAKSGSDKSLAESLKVPVRWVADLRELVMGGPNANEDDVRRLSSARDLEARAKALSEEAMTHASRLEEIAAEASKLVQSLTTLDKAA